MKQLRFWAIFLILWLAFLFNTERVIERISEEIGSPPINITYSYTYVFVLVTVIFTLLSPRLRKRYLVVLLAIFIVSYFLLTLYYYREGILTELPLTITQIGAMVLTALITLQLNHSVNKFEDVVKSISLNRTGQVPKPFLEEQGAMYNEVKRARRYERPVSLVALKFDSRQLDVAYPQIVQEIQEAMLEQFTITSMAQIIRNKTHGFDTIALHNDYFLIILPEISGDKALQKGRVLSDEIKTKLGLTVQTGMANYPENASTFERLVELATENANQVKSTKLSP
ncbi:hypothetical protein QUF64_16000 [Anaerolineales bacterium HSG6]|nr:hypothetical protein [Anaerolineales bacterium HSG6]